MSPGGGGITICSVFIIGIAIKIGFATDSGMKNIFDSDTECRFAECECEYEYEEKLRNIVHFMYCNMVQTLYSYDLYRLGNNY